MQKIDYEEMAKRLATRGIRGYKQKFIEEEDLLSGEDKRRVLEEIDKLIETIKEDKLFFKTKDVRHANRYKAYKELLEKE